MDWIDPQNALHYLHQQGRLDPDVAATVGALAWGVSNVVLRIEPAAGEHFVIKQSREQLRTKADWFSRLDRIFREAETLRVLEVLLPAGVIPRVLFEDRANYLFAMQAVPANHVVWKEELLQGQVDVGIAVTAAGYLATIHARTCGDSDLKDRMGDREVFDELRIDPFYRHIAAKHPQIANVVVQLIDELLGRPICLVHADFSPKNILVVRDSQNAAGRVALVDFETAHFGDPAFDLGFFFSHLLLKTVRHADRAGEFLVLIRAFHSQYFAEMERIDVERAVDRGELDRRSIGHTAACMLARIDGKSTIDYLPSDADQSLVREFSLAMLAEPPNVLNALFDELGRRLVRRRS